MKISTEINSAAVTVGEQKAVEYVAKAGFDAWDFSMFRMIRYDWQKQFLLENDHPLAQSNYLSFARELKKIGEDCGIHCNQSHAPFPSHLPGMMTYLKRAIECTAEAGGKTCIIHPCNRENAEYNRDMYLELLPFAKECGVKIATENMFCWDNEKDMCTFAACMSPEDFNAHLDAVNDEYFTACLDIGHAEMIGTGTSAVEMIHALGKRLTALHIHDNDKRHDLHAIPFSMNIDFEAVVKALREINYSGYFTLEADSYLADFDESNVFEGIKNLAASAKRLAEMFEK